MLMLWLLFVGAAFAAESGQDYCARYADCRISALEKISSCHYAFSVQYLSDIPSDNVTLIDRNHCEIELSKLIAKTLKPLYKQIESRTKQCTAERPSNITDNQSQTCQNISIILQPPTSRDPHECAKDYQNDITLCNQLASCCPQHEECYNEAQLDANVEIKRSKVITRFEACIANPPNKVYLTDGIIRKKLAAGLKETKEAQSSTTSDKAEDVDSKEADASNEAKKESEVSVPKAPVAEPIKVADPPKPIVSAQVVLSVPEEARDEKAFSKDSSPLNVKAAYRKQDKNNAPSDEWDVAENDAWKVEGSEENELKVAPPTKISIHKNKPILEMTDTELRKLEHDRIKEALLELRNKNNKGQVAADDVGEITSEKRVIHNMVCSQYMECADIVENLDDECEHRFPVEVEENHGIADRHIRWHFLNVSKAMDPKIKSACLKDIDPISQAQIQVLQKVVNEQNQKCTSDRAVGRKSADFDGCQNVGLVSELVAMAGKPIEEVEQSSNLEKQHKCKERHSQFARKCGALKSCCPDAAVCDKTNQSVEARRLRSLKNALGAEQRLCEQRLQRNQEATKTGISGSSIHV